MVQGYGSTISPFIGALKLVQNTQIEEIDIAHENISIIDLVSILHKCPQLKKINISLSCTIKVTPSGTFASGFSIKTAYMEASSNQDSRSFQDPKSFNKLRPLEQLVELKLGASSYGSESKEWSLIHVLSRCPNLVKLNLFSYSIVNAELLAKMPELRHLEELILQDAAIATNVLKAFKLKCPKLN
jgi:hypothetical protein